MACPIRTLRSYILLFVAQLCFCAVSALAQETPCGGEGERACCWLEQPAIGACKPGLKEVAQPNSGWCKGHAAQSNGICVAITECGGEGERACCWLEQAFGACAPGLVELAQPNSGWCANSAVQSNGVCHSVEPCGGEGQRACCGGEQQFGACQNQRLREIVAPNSGWCANSLVQSNGRCYHKDCGQSGKPACEPFQDNIIYEYPTNSCDPGLIRINGTCYPWQDCGQFHQRPCVHGERATPCDDSFEEYFGRCDTRRPQPLPDDHNIPHPVLLGTLTVGLHYGPAPAPGGGGWACSGTGTVRIRDSNNNQRTLGYDYSGSQAYAGQPCYTSVAPFSAVPKGDWTIDVNGIPTCTKQVSGYVGVSINQDTYLCDN